MNDFAHVDQEQHDATSTFAGRFSHHCYLY